MIAATQFDIASEAGLERLEFQGRFSAATWRN
jgi:hypothetical protein